VVEPDRGSAAASSTVPISLTVGDGRRLGGALSLPAVGTARAAVLLAGAMAVPHRFYGSFSEFLAAGGCAVLRFDYRGIGASREGTVGGEPARLREWGEVDVAGALDWLAGRYPGLPLGLVGHSAGGWLPALAPNRGRLGAMVTIASQSGWSGHWPWPGRLKLLLFWRLVLPAVVAACGYLPGRILGSESIPRGVAREWAHWARSPDFLRSRRRGSETAVRAGSASPELGEFDGPLRAYAIAGDTYAPVAAVRRLPDFYPAARSEVQVFSTLGRNGERPGHFNVFRDSFSESLWKPACAWLRNALGAQATASLRA
jgi:predicted alpha/beta hydrolase